MNAVWIALAGVAGAEEDLKKAMEVAPNDPTAYARLGILRMLERRDSEAEKLFEQALSKNPNFSEAMQDLAGLYVQQKQYGKALTRLNEQIAKVPDNSKYYSLLATLEMVNKQPDKAEAAAQKAVQLDQNDENAFLLLARIQVIKGSLDQAVANYQKLAQENPQDVRPLMLLAMLQDTRGNWQQAQNTYLKALQAQPDYPLAANNLAYLLLEHGGNPDVALSYAQVAKRGLPESINAADTLAWAYYAKGSYRLAIDLLEDAVKKNPRNATYEYHLGMAYQGAKDAAQAKEHLEKALEIDPKYPKAEEIRKTLAQLSSG